MTASASADAPTTEPPLLRRGRAAKLIGVDPTTIARWARANLIDSKIMPNGERRYPESALAPYLPSAAAEVRTG